MNPSNWIVEGTGNLFWDEAVRDVLITSISVLLTAYAGYKVYLKQQIPERKSGILAELAALQISLQGAIYEYLVVKVDIQNFRTSHGLGIFVEQANTELNAAQQKLASSTKYLGEQLSILSKTVYQARTVFTISKKVSELLDKALLIQYPEVTSPDLNSLKAHIGDEGQVRQVQVGKALEFLSGWYDESLKTAETCAKAASSNIIVLQKELSMQLKGAEAVIVSLPDPSV